VRRRLGPLSLAAGVVALAVAAAVPLSGALAGASPVAGVAPATLVTKAALLAAVGLLAYGAYRILFRWFVDRAGNKRRAHDARNVLRLVVGAAAVAAALGVLTDRWVGVLLSLGVVGFAVTFALQQPLLSLLAWAYVMLKRPYAVGDRVEIAGSKGDVIAVDFLVTTLWEVGGDLVSSNQPSGRVVTVPNSVVLSAQVVNFGGAGVEHVWNEITVQVAYETDLAFAREAMVEEATELLGAEMAANVAEYRRTLAETPVELEVSDGPSVNVVQRESWVDLRLRYLVHPRRGQRTKNELYRRVLDRFTDDPERVKFPVGRNR
jgi:small-conductance mechanosensitive channel